MEKLSQRMFHKTKASGGDTTGRSEGQHVPCDKSVRSQRTVATQVVRWSESCVSRRERENMGHDASSIFVETASRAREEPAKESRESRTYVCSLSLAG